MATRTIELDHGETSWLYVAADFRQMPVDGFDIDGGQHQARAYAMGRADGNKDIAILISQSARRAGMRASVGPDLGQAILLAAPGFILEPDLDGFAAHRLGDHGGDHVGMESNGSMGSSDTPVK